jgi:hypothetical protein
VRKRCGAWAGIVNVGVALPHRGETSDDKIGAVKKNDPEVLTAARTVIKAKLPDMYEAFWAECDTGQYFDLSIASANLNRLRARNMLLRSGTRVLRWAYRDVIERAAMALAAETTAVTIGDPGLAAHFRFVIRNREAADAARAFLRFLDQTTYHLYEVSGRKLITVKRPRDVSFARLEQDFTTAKNAGSRRVVAAARSVISAARADFTEDGWLMLQNFRNVDTHRFVVGIDHIVYGFGPVSKDDPVRAGGRLLIMGDPDAPKYALFAEPDLDFETVAKLLRICMHNAKIVLAGLASRRFLLEDRTL